MGAFIDARTVPSGTVVRADLAIVGGGPAAITLAMALAATRLKIVILESGGFGPETPNQALNRGTTSGLGYPPLDHSRARYFGGGSNHWGGACLAFDAQDFADWPISLQTLESYYPKAFALCDAGAPFRDAGQGTPHLALASGGLATGWFQYSRARAGRPTHFGDRYAAELKRSPRLQIYLQATVTRLGLDGYGRRVRDLDVQTFNGRRFTVKPRATVIATGAIETARLMLASSDVMRKGVGNYHGLVGRYFADHAVPRDGATLALFDGAVPPALLEKQAIRGTAVRAALFATPAWRKKTGQASCLTLENSVDVDAFGKAAIAATAEALGTNSRHAAIHTLGGHIELSPDKNRRVRLADQRDAFGMPRAHVEMTIAPSDFSQFRLTLKELGRQFLAARSGILKLNYKAPEDWLANLDWANHHMGTTRMSADAKSGVVNANLKVHGIANLYVAGAAVFPRYGIAEPLVNILALTLRLADHLKGKLK